MQKIWSSIASTCAAGALCFVVLLGLSKGGREEEVEESFDEQWYKPSTKKITEDEEGDTNYIGDTFASIEEFLRGLIWPGCAGIMLVPITHFITGLWIIAVMVFALPFILSWYMKNKSTPIEPYSTPTGKTDEWPAKSTGTQITD